MKPEEQRAAQFLREVGLRVVELPTRTIQTCDFGASDDEHRYLVEVKLRKSPDLTAWTDFEPHSRPVGLDYKETQRKLHKAAGQLKATRQSPDEFAVPWITIASGHDQEILLTQVVDTFFGVQRIGEPPYRKWKRCYYFGESVCFRHPEVSALMVDAKGAVRLCINTLSPTLVEFRRSTLFQFFAQRAWTIDPDQEERDGISLLADCALDRRDERSILDYVKAKYNLRSGAINIVMKEHSAIARIPLSDLEE